MSQVVYFCRGSSCKKQKRQKALRKLLRSKFLVANVRCQKVCKGPVVGIELAGKLEWFRKFDGETDLVPLSRLAQGRKLSKSLLADKRAKKRSGKLR